MRNAVFKLAIRLDYGVDMPETRLPTGSTRAHNG